VGRAEIYRSIKPREGNMKKIIVPAVALVIALFASSVLGDTNKSMKYRELGNIQHQKGDYAGAIDAYSMAIKEEPNNPVPYILRANEEHLIKDYKAALKDCDDALNKSEKLILSLRVNGILSQIKGKAGAWEKSKDDVKGLEKAIATVYSMRGTIKFELKDMKGAKADLDKSVKLDGDTAAFYVNRAMYCFSVKDNKGALADMDKAILLNPDNARYYAMRSDAERDLGDNKGAMQDLDRCIEIAPNAKQYNNRADLKNVMGDYTGALTDVNRSISMDPKHAASYCTRGEIENKLSKYAAAVKDFSKAVELAPEDRDMAEFVYYNRGLAEIKLNKKTEAVEDLKKSADMGNKEAAEKLKEVQGK
jgi:tetratricopeptide (TPR) repeat protein